MADSRRFFGDVGCRWRVNVWVCRGVNSIQPHKMCEISTHTEMQICVADTDFIKIVFPAKRHYLTIALSADHFHGCLI